MVGGGQRFELGSQSDLAISNPNTFFGHIDADAAAGGLNVLAENVSATAFSFNGSELVLYNGNTPVDRLSLTDDTGRGFAAFGGMLSPDGVHTVPVVDVTTVGGRPPFLPSFPLQHLG